MGSKDGFVELGVLHMNLVSGVGRFFVCQGAMLGTSGMTPERFELVEFGLGVSPHQLSVPFIY